MYKFGFIIFLIFITCCSGSPDVDHSSNGNLANNSHPTQQNIPSNENAADILVIGNQNLTDEERLIANKMINLQELASIGKMDGSTDEMFGRIEDIAIDSRNRIYLLDRIRQRVGVFSSNGAHIKTLGRRGRGPGEFESARSLAVLDDQLLLVSNGFRLEVFNISDDIEFRESVLFERPINSMCISDNTLFIQSEGFIQQDEVQGENYRKMIHAYAITSFEHLFSFGQSYKSNNPLVIESMSVGNLSCNDVTSTVVFAFERMQVIQGYSSIDGSLKWITRFDDLNQPKITEISRDGRPGMSYGLSENNIMDRISPPVNLHDEYQIVQVLRTSSRTDIESTYFSFLLNSSNGTGTFLSDQIPNISAVYKEIAVSKDLYQDFLVTQIYHLNHQE